MQVRLFAGPLRAWEVLEDWLRGFVISWVILRFDSGQTLPYSPITRHRWPIWMSFGIFLDVLAIEQRLDYKIRTAINHDVNGQPWPYWPSFMIQAGVDFYLTGINVHLWHSLSNGLVLFSGDCGREATARAESTIHFLVNLPTLKLCRPLWPKGVLMKYMRYAPRPGSL